MVINMCKFWSRKNKALAAFLLVCCITVSMLYSTPAYALEVTQTDVKMYTTSGTPVGSTIVVVQIVVFILCNLIGLIKR